jgi:SAM-dependent methyltransferase
MSDEKPGILGRIDRLRDPSQYRYLSGEELRYFLNPDPGWTVADFGSGTGFYTDEIAPVVEKVYAVDILAEMHEHYREHGLPSNVETVTADFAETPFEDGALDGALSTRTFHHGFETALDEIARTLRVGGRFVIVDWSATGAGERETPVEEEYFDLATVQSLLLDAGFSIRTAKERRETFVVVASLDG